MDLLFMSLRMVIITVNNAHNGYWQWPMRMVNDHCRWFRMDTRCKLELFFFARSILFFLPVMHSGMRSVWLSFRDMCQCFLATVCCFSSRSWLEHGVSLKVLGSFCFPLQLTQFSSRACDSKFCQHQIGTAYPTKTWNCTDAEDDDVKPSLKSKAANRCLFENLDFCQRCSGKTFGIHTSEELFQTAATSFLFVKSACRTNVFEGYEPW